MDGSRFDGFAKSLAAGAPRRRLLGVGAALGLGALLGRGGRAPAARAAKCSKCCEFGEKPCCCSNDCRCVSCCSFGVAGAGLVEVVGDGVSFALFASRITAATGPEALRGHVWWEQPSRAGGPVGFASERIDAYGPLPGDERGRMIGGVGSPAGVAGGPAPFLVHLHVGAAGEDSTVRLWAGDAVAAAGGGTPTPGAGFAYAAEGPVRVGGLTLLKLDQPVPEGATPAA